MKNDKTNKKKILPQEEQKKRVKKIKPEQQQEQEYLLFQADSISPAKKRIDLNEIELNSGEKINLDDYILENYITEKSTHFYKQFYFLIADLLCIDHERMKKFIKPLIVPFLKKYLIYARFPNKVQQRLYSRNKYTGFYSRICWNYQWLTRNADLELRDFISQFEKDAEEVLKSGGNMKKFIEDYCQKYNLPVQQEIFELL